MIIVTIIIINIILPAAALEPKKKRGREVFQARTTAFIAAHSPS